MAELALRQIDAVAALLRAAADGELASEQMRCRLGECQDFDPFKVFQNLQGSWKSHRGHLSSYSVLRWLQSQPHHLAGARIEDLSAMLTPYEGHLDEIRYEGFLSLVLPKDPAHLWLKDAVLARVSRKSWPHSANEDHIPPDVAYRLCQLFENEIDALRHLKFHHKNLMELGVTPSRICKFLDKEQGVCAGMGGLISPVSLRRTLVDELKAMTTTQCDALLQRINPSRACLLPFHELAKVLGLGHASFPTSSWTHKADVKEAFDTLGFSRDTSGDDGIGLSSSRISLRASPLQDPIGPLSPSGYKTAPMASVGVDTNGDGRVDTYVTGADRNYDGIPDVLQRQTGPVASIGLDTNGDGRVDTYITGADRSRDGIPDALQLRDTSRLLSPTRLLYDEEPQSNFKDMRPDPLSRSLGAWSSSPVTPRRNSPDLPLTTRTINFENPLFKAPSGYDKLRLWSPAVTSPGLASTQASTADFLSPRRLNSFASPSPQRQWSYTSPLKDPGYPTRSSSVGATRHRDVARISSPLLDRRESVPQVLKVIALQGQLDAQIEDAKSLINPALQLECIWEAISRFKKDNITDADLWSFCQAFGGPSYGSLCALLHEVHLRRPRHQLSASGKWTFRDLASFILQVDTPEYEAITSARSDDDARSIAYLLRNSDPCPGCGIRIQRDADSAGCPTVTCTICRMPFKCYAVLSDYTRPDFQLSVAGQYQLYRMISQAATCAYELEQAREKLSLLPGGDAMCTLSAVFSYISEGRLSISIDDLHRCFLNHSIDVSMKELFLLRQRYGKAASQVSFSDFVRQLSPRSSPFGL